MTPESTLLGCCTLDPECLDKALEAGVTASHFTDPDRETLWKSFIDLRARGKGMDLATVALELGNSCPFTAYSECEQAAPTTINFKTALDGLLWAYKARSLLAHAEALTELLNRREGPETVIPAVSSLQDIVEEAHDAKAPDMAAATREVETQLQEAIEGKLDTRKTYPLPLAKMDKEFGAVYSHEFILVGARPSVGKTSFCIQMAAENGRKGYNVAYIATEMSAPQVIAQMAAQSARVNWRNLHHEMPENLKRAKQFTESIRQSKRFRVYDRDLSIQSIRHRCRLLAGWADIVFIDHLAQISNPGKSRYESVSDTCHQMVEIQKMLGCPLVLAHQLKRLADKNTVPSLQDLRDSGAAEEDASRILLIHFPDTNHQGVPQVGLDIEPPDTRDYYVLQSKHRYGVRDVAVRCQYHAPTTRFC
jgi:replicative DNA helicase